MYSFASILAFITILLRLSSAETDNPVVDGFYPFILVYKNDTVQRILNITLVPPSLEDPVTGVSSKDINISTELLARIYLPKLKAANQKLPIFIWFHGGGFFMGSAFADTQQAFLNIMASRAGAIAISVDYRLVPEHHLPTAYEDAWTALQWVTAHKTRSSCGEPWLLQYGDFDRIFIGGDSAGANIVHNTLMRAGLERPKGGSIKILGGIQTHPYFWGSNETYSIDWFQRFANFVWRFAYPTAPGGIDNPMVNPFTENAPSLTLLGSSKLFV
ncbi:PREDICTED: 2-hydroxyisoflavanone dehydratase-like [Ipomoea nil]|uniref:2-hydroxyisoflavanone dehydratase-like n=1 Tax=Ipomoea nil TaxID=35883 RepID=UPI0009010FD6|nr:PREDICTED: 2-hydroxyisoflavanone dehydratase-like [Ipomoea nil]